MSNFIINEYSHYSDKILLTYFVWKLFRSQMAKYRYIKFGLNIYLKFGMTFIPGFPRCFSIKVAKKCNLCRKKVHQPTSTWVPQIPDSYSPSVWQSDSLSVRLFFYLSVRQSVSSPVKAIFFLILAINTVCEVIFFVSAIKYALLKKNYLYTMDIFTRISVVCVAFNF